MARIYGLTGSIGMGKSAVAAMFQKDPQALIAHPGQGYERFESLAKAPVVKTIRFARTCLSGVCSSSQSAVSSIRVTCCPVQISPPHCSA